MLHISTLDPSTYQLLRDLFKIPCIKETFALAGGTSLALQIGHRKSIDLDFFSNSEFNVKELEIILQSNKTTFSNMQQQQQNAFLDLLIRLNVIYTRTR
ncbi:MAG: nucleotidyl transferase AbiEii/AbiGii toxin family protein [Saprospiraceae bacterium]|nr:nucleotidyl transferase AbiEii/AbiGii toxin family protein [Candidatus Vicinibacter affinis]